jgi:hypothetical protein
MNGKHLGLSDQSTLNEPDAVGSYGPWLDALDLPSKFPVTNPPALVVAQHAVHEYFERRHLGLVHSALVSGSARTYQTLLVSLKVRCRYREAPRPATNTWATST